MEYTFVDADGQLYTQFFNSKVTVGDAKLFLPRLSSVPHRISSIFYRNRILENPTLLSSLRITPGPPFAIEYSRFSFPPAPPPRSPPSLPFDATAYARMIRLELFEFINGSLVSRELVLDTKTKVGDLEFFSSKVYKSHVLLTGRRRLCDYAVTPGSTLRVFPRAPYVPKSILVFFKTRAIPGFACPPHVGQKSFHLFVPSNCQILILKRYVAALFKIEQRWIILSFMEQMLEDRFTLEDYGYMPNGTIDCAVGPVDGERVRVCFDRFGTGFTNVTAHGAAPSITLRSVLDDNGIPGRSALMAVRPRNEVLRPMEQMGQIAHNNALSIGVYCEQDPVMLIQTEDDGQFLVELDETTTIYQLKVKMREATKIPIARQILTIPSRDESLPDGAAVRSFRGLHNKVMFLRERPPSGRVLLVRVDDTVIGVPMAGPDDPASDAKWVVGREIGSDEDDFDLGVPGGRLADPEARLWQAGVSDRTTIVGIRDGEPTVQVIVTAETDDWEIELPLAASVGIAKEIIAQLRIGGFTQIRLYYNGEYLDNDDILIEALAIAPGSRIFVTPIRTADSPPSLQSILPIRL
jgi:hypothetical protein